jgi:hypothetical protein
MHGLITILIILVSILVSIRQGKGRRLFPLIFGLIMIGAQFFAMGSAMNRLIGDVADIKSHIKTNADAIKVIVIVLPIAILWIYGTWKIWKKQGKNIFIAAVESVTSYVAVTTISILILSLGIQYIINLFF